MYKNIAYDELDHILSASPIPGGVESMFYGRFEDIGALDYIDVNTGIIPYVNFFQGKLYKVFAAPSGRGLQEIPESTNGGTMYNISAEGFVPFANKRNAQTMQASTNLKVAVILFMQDGNIKMMGDFNNPASMFMENNTGSHQDNIPGYTVRFTWQNDLPAPLIREDNRTRLLNAAGL